MALFKFSAHARRTPDRTFIIMAKQTRLHLCRRPCRGHGAPAAAGADASGARVAPRDARQSVADGGWRVVNIGAERPVGLMDFIAAVERAIGRQSDLQFRRHAQGDVPMTFADTVAAVSTRPGLGPRTPLLGQGVDGVVRAYRESPSDRPEHPAGKSGRFRNLKRSRASVQGVTSAAGAAAWNPTRAATADVGWLHELAGSTGVAQNRRRRCGDAAACDHRRGRPWYRRSPAHMNKRKDFFL